MFHFWILHQILIILKEKIIIIANVFPKLETVKNLVRPLSKNRRFKTRFDSQHVKASKILAKSPWEHIYHVFSSFSGKFISKISPLLIGEILGVFVHTVTADDKYPVQDCENLPLPIIWKTKNFSSIFFFFLFFHFWNLHPILKVLKKNMIVIPYVFPKLKTVKNLAKPLSKKRRFRKRFDSQHVKTSQILAKYTRENLYHVFSSFSRKLIRKMFPPSFRWNLRCVC